MIKALETGSLTKRTLVAVGAMVAACVLVVGALSAIALVVVGRAVGPTVDKGDKGDTPALVPAGKIDSQNPVVAPKRPLGATGG